MKIIFLDIDGVLNHQLFYEEQEFRAHTDIDRSRISLLNNLIEDTNAKVVISSTWRIGTTIEELQTILNDEGFTGEVIGKTPQGGNDCCRGNEIYKWIKDNDKLLGKPYYEFKDYVIFDDDSDMLLCQRNNFLLVDNFVGLTPNLMHKARFILTGKYS